MIHLLHGAAGTPGDWDEFIPLLHREDVRAVDLCEKKETGLDGFAASFNSSASQGDAIIGYSMGGRLALHAILADTHPWSCAVIISAHSGILNTNDREKRAKSDLRWAELASRDWEEFIVEWASQRIFGGKALPWNRSDESKIDRRIQRCFTSWSLGRQRPLLPELEFLQIPILWIAGAQDSMFSAIAETAVARIPQAQLALIANAGHRCPWDQPELTADVIRGFLSQ
ncbi:MAG: alpha/beta fold hydrolase [Verrucomicrobiales bacterium]